MFVALLFPAHGEIMLLGPLEERRRHRRPHELSTNAIYLRHKSPSLLARRGLQFEGSAGARPQRSRSRRAPTYLNERLREPVPHRGRTTHGFWPAALWGVPVTRA